MKSTDKFVLVLVASLSLLLAFMATNLAIAGSTPQPTTDTAFFCEQNYNNASNARHTCNGESFTTVDQLRARLSATCEMSMANQFKATSVTVEAIYCGDLENCNGTLQLDSC